MLFNSKCFLLFFSLIVKIIIMFVNKCKKAYVKQIIFPMIFSAIFVFAKQQQGRQIAYQQSCQVGLKSFQAKFQKSSLVSSWLA